MFKPLSAVFLVLFFACACNSDTGKSADATQAEKVAKGSLTDMAEAIRKGEVTSEAIVKVYLDRIEKLDRSGPTLNSIVAVNPAILDVARQMDTEAAKGEFRGPLHGVPILIKDNIETSDDMPTTAGALALKDNQNGRDAPSIAGLRSAGAIILGKTNLSQWANFRSTESISGWSSIGGQVRNPHMLSRSPCGSSSGSGAATAAALAAGAVGTETNGSIICPSVMNGIVGFKPTVGLVSRTHIVPISPTQDTAGPMTRSVEDAALMLTTMAGTDPADPATTNADANKTDYYAALQNAPLQGKRIGVMRFAQGNSPEITALFEEALKVLETNGAILVDINNFTQPDNLWGNEFLVLKTEFKESLNSYLASTGDKVSVRSLTDLITFNEAHANIELNLFNQDILIASSDLPGLDDWAYRSALETILTGTRQNGIDRLLSEYDVDVLITPTSKPAFLIDAVHGDNFPSGVGVGWMAAIAGYPHLTVPMGKVRGLPVGISFMASAWQDAEVLSAGYVYEQNSNKLSGPKYLRNAEDVQSIKASMTPLGDHSTRQD